MVPVTEKEYKVVSNDGVISGVFKNIFFNDKFIYIMTNNLQIMAKIVLGDQKHSIGKNCFCVFYSLWLL